MVLMHDVNDWFTRHFGGLQTESSHQSLHVDIACVSYELAEGQEGVWRLEAQRQWRLHHVARVPAVHPDSIIIGTESRYGNLS